jgi:rhodanese-related sulfurtransferase
MWRDTEATMSGYDMQKYIDSIVETPSWVILDVRELIEIKGKNLPKKNKAGYDIPKIDIPLDQVMKADAAKMETWIPKTKTVYCLCASGARSSMSTAHLKKLGYNAMNISGGIYGMS